MLGFYNVRPKMRTGRRSRSSGGGSFADPYAPGSEDYRSRSQATETKIGHGMTRVDLGEPLKRLASEPQAIPVPVAPAEQPLPVPDSAPQAPVAARVNSKGTRPRSWRDDCGLRRSD